jgi:hypothetical protein
MNGEGVIGRMGRMGRIRRIRRIVMGELIGPKARLIRP